MSLFFNRTHTLNVIGEWLYPRRVWEMSRDPPPPPQKKGKNINTVHVCIMHIGYMGLSKLATFPMFFFLSAIAPSPGVDTGDVMGLK